MGFLEPTSEKIGSQVKFLAGAIPGAMLSRGVASFVPGGSLGKLGLAAVAGLAAASITGKGTGVELGKGALAGMAVQQGVEAISELLAPTLSGVVAGITNPTIKDFASKTAGLGAADSFFIDTFQPAYQPQEALACAFPDRPLPLGV